MASALAFDHISFKRLDPFFITLNNFIIDCNIVACLEFWEFFLAGQLLMYVCDGVHFCNFKEGKGRVGVGKFQIKKATELRASSCELLSLFKASFKCEKHLLFLIYFNQKFRD